MEISEVRVLGRGVPDFVFVEVEAEGLTGIGIAQTHGPADRGADRPARHRVVSRQSLDLGIERFCENLRRYREGEPLLGLVDKEGGY